MGCGWFQQVDAARQNASSPAWLRPGTDFRNHASSGISTDALLKCGVVGPLLFIVVFLIEGAARQDYNAFRSMVSELSLSNDGWQQIVNFLVTGTLLIAFAAGLRRVVHGGRVSALGSRLLTVTGIGLTTAGVFVADPGLAYPAGAPAGLPMGTGSWHGLLHQVSGFVVFFSLPVACLLLARLTASDVSKSWKVFSLATIAFAFGSFMASNIAAMHGGPAGLFQRLSICAYFIRLAVMALRLRKDASEPSAARQPKITTRSALDTPAPLP